MARIWKNTITYRRGPFYGTGSFDPLYLIEDLLFKNLKNVSINSAKVDLLG